jgi:predicted metalloprotease
VAACGGGAGKSPTVAPASTAPAPATTTPPTASLAPVPSASPSPDTSALHAAIDKFVADIGRYWTVNYPALYGTPYVPPSDLIVYHGRSDAPLCDGARLRQGNAYYCPQADYIAWHEDGLMLPLYDEAGDFAVAFVIAHEWGHAMAAHAHANLPETIFGELQADCFAGAYAEWATNFSRILDGNYDAAVFAMYQFRDRAGTPWLDPAAHGTALERIQAFTRGLEDGAEFCAGFAIPSPFNTPPEIVPGMSPLYP